MGTRFILCLVCLGLTAALKAECLTSLPMPQLEDCILAEAAGRSYAVEARLDFRQSGSGPEALLQRSHEASGAGATVPEIPGMDP